MNPWIIITLFCAMIVFVIDYLLRRKKWKENTKEEKISLIVHMFSIGPYVFLSVLGMFWGILLGQPKTAFGKMLYDATLLMGEWYFVIAIIAIIMSFVLRKKGKIKSSIWINVIAIVYIVVVLFINSFIDKIL